MTSFSYRGANGVRHEIVVRRTAAGDWQVLDTCADETSVIESLDGLVDGEPQAEAVARDYAANRARPDAAPGREAAGAIPEQGGADADNDRRPRSAPRQPRVSTTALPHPAG
jgi:hypothetical protein